MRTLSTVAREPRAKVRIDGPAGMLIRLPAPVTGLLRAMVANFTAASHPRSTLQRWRQMRRWPHPGDFDRMSPAEFDGYVERIGFDARIKVALAEPITDSVPVHRNAGLAAVEGESQLERARVAPVRAGPDPG